MRDSAALARTSGKLLEVTQSSSCEGKARSDSACTGVPSHGGNESPVLWGKRFEIEQVEVRLISNLLNFKAAGL